MWYVCKIIRLNLDNGKKDTVPDNDLNRFDNNGTWEYCATMFQQQRDWNQLGVEVCKRY